MCFQGYLISRNGNDEIPVHGGGTGTPSPPPRFTHPPKPATLTGVRKTHFSSTGSVRVGFESHVLFSRYTTYEIRYTSFWRTQLQPIRIIGEITAYIKMLPLCRLCLYQELSQKATQLRLSGMTYEEIAASPNINRRTATKIYRHKRR